MNERLSMWLSVAGACFIAFVLGAAALHYRTWPAGFFIGAFESASAWRVTLEGGNPDTGAPSGLILEDYSAINEVILSEARVAAWDKKRAYGDYTLVTTGFMDSAFLVDMNGMIVHRWNLPFNEAWPNPTHTHPATRPFTFFDCALVFPNGDLLVQYSALRDTPYGYGIAKIDKNAKVIWRFSDNAHHDLYLDEEDGDIYALTHRMVQKPLADLEQLPYPMLADDIVRLSADGKERERIPVLDAFRGTPYELLLYHEKNGALARWDHLHTNSVVKLESRMATKFPMFKAGYLLISIRSLNAIAVIDPVKRKVVWAMIGPWKQQHAAKFLENGNILLFNNAGYVIDRKSFSNVLEVNPATQGVMWHYSGTKERPLRSSIVGRVQRLANGNTLIAESMKARILEITRDGDIVWDYSLRRIKRPDPTMNAVLTSVRYRADELPFLKEKSNAR